MQTDPPWPRCTPAETGALAPGELRLWWCPESDDTQPRRQRIDALLRCVLAPTVLLTVDVLRFGRESKGRPFLDHAGAPDFNLSDTHGGSLIAITGTGRVGVDLERLDREPPVLRLAQRWFSPGEAAALAVMPEDDARRAFLQLWTAKEASCKATGTGIYGFLPLWAFDALREQPRLRDLPEDAGSPDRWHFLRVRPSREHTAVLALRDVAVGELRCFTLVAD